MKNIKKRRKIFEKPILYYIELNKYRQDKLNDRKK